ncbi:prolyl oligopeptidase family serine peptidase [Brevibacterium marinum]|uniref:Dipeptidyl aminopeptidase/acylaminoacyl peptidase n=1 Tax=Brevibacterium marinum TaxID=418643 RepID=A0A846S4I3_9MICO|nr:prolyl oligopeptidase family serine peptidase [Brevibacterium marinum]NJC55767.1 dipeptidyl aminopeptidase/acylaminoacyl peptidase [Brevibacterium marinum]
MTTQHDATASSNGRETSNWEARFNTPYLHTVRPAMGNPHTALVIENHRHGVRGRLLAPEAGSSRSVLSDILPVDVNFESFLSPDARWVVSLDDGGGSEVGGLLARSVDGAESVHLTPDREPYVIRGMEFSTDGSTLLATIVDDEGFHLLSVPAHPWGEAAVIWSSRNEAWYGHVSADASLFCVDSTNHNPGWRRTAVTVVDALSGEEIAVCNDMVDGGPVRAVRFSPLAGDDRLLLSTEKSGFARPALWSPSAGERTDYPLPALAGEVLPLDWDPGHSQILSLHVDAGIHRLLLLDTDTGELSVVRQGTGSYAAPDVAAEFAYSAQSYLDQTGGVFIFEQSWNTPPALIGIDHDGESSVVIAAPELPAGVPLNSELVTSADGTPVQLWWAIPAGEVRGTILSIHGGPNLVTTDHYAPEAQAWLAEGFAFASLNYRGSVTFGREFREGFWTGYGDREIADIRAVMDRLRELGVAAPGSSFVTGASYGGHLTLLSMGRLPEYFAGGFAVVAMADWATAFEEMNAALRPVWEKVLANGELSFEEACAKLSSTSYVDQVQGSVVLFQGARDSRTPPAQARNYIEKLRASGGDVSIEWFDAGHSPAGLAIEHEWLERELGFVALTESSTRWSDKPGG